MTDRRDHGAGDERARHCSNDRRVGPLREVQLPTECITSLHGILFDFDPKICRPTIPRSPRRRPGGIPRQHSAPVLERHPLARHAEVRVSGTGLHLILWLSPAAEMRSAGDQAFWAAVVKAGSGHAADRPGHARHHRPHPPASGPPTPRTVPRSTRLKAGEPVNPQDVLAFLRESDSAPFREVAVPMLGGERLSPCPVCGVEDTRLDVRDRSGMCYGGCGQVTLVGTLQQHLRPAACERAVRRGEGQGRDGGAAPDRSASARTGPPPWRTTGGHHHRGSPP